MQPGPYEEVPLTADERDMLFTIYDSRRRFLLVVYIFLISLGIAADYKGIQVGHIHVSYKEYNEGSSVPFSWIFGVCFLETIIVGSGLYLLFTRILPYRRDLKYGVKEKVPYAVVKKQYFPITNQYYLTLDDPKYLYHETDADMYNSVYEGGNVYLYRAKYSKYVFEDNGRFTII